MAKESGLGWTACTVDNAAGVAKDIKRDVTNLDWSTPMNTAVVTGLDQLAEERLGLLMDFNGTLNTAFNPAADRQHAVLSTGDLRVARTLLLTVSAQILTNEVLFTDSKYTRSANGEFTGQHPFVLQSGIVPTWTT
jgi:hypothetical protein